MSGASISIVLDQGAAGTQAWKIESDQLAQIIAALGATLSVNTGLQQGLTNTELRAALVAVKDDYSGAAHEEDQSGAGAVLSFDLGTPSPFVIVDADNDDSADFTAYRCRARLDGTDPTETIGFVCRSGQSTYLPFPSTGTVKVWAPAGVTVAVQRGLRS